MRRPISLLLLIAALLAALTAAALAQTDTDFQVRSRLDVSWALATNWAAITWGEGRLLDNASTLSNWRLGQRIQYRPLTNLLVGVGYTYIRQDGIEPFTGQDIDSRVHRLELEATPGLTDACGNRWQCRFRPEWVHRESNDQDVEQVRLRPEFVMPIHDCWRLKEFRASNEFFISLEDGQYRQNRAIPLSFGFSLFPAAELRLQYVLDSINLPRGWVNAHAFQTQVLVNLR